MENIKVFFGSCRLQIKDVVQSTVFLSSMSLFEESNLEYSKYFECDFPARATVGIILKPGALIEVSVVAYKDLP